MGTTAPIIGVDENQKYKSEVWARRVPRGFAADLDFGKSSCKMDDFSLASADPVSVKTAQGRLKCGFLLDPANYSIQGLAPGETARLELYPVEGISIFKRILVPGSGAEPVRLPLRQEERGQSLLKIISGGNASLLKVTIAR